MKRDVLVSDVKWIFWTGMYLNLGLSVDYNHDKVIR